MAAGIILKADELPPPKAYAATNQRGGIQVVPDVAWVSPVLLVRYQPTRP
jgi:hypothetical protein